MFCPISDTKFFCFAFLAGSFNLSMADSPLSSDLEVEVSPSAGMTSRLLLGPKQRLRVRCPGLFGHELNVVLCRRRTHSGIIKRYKKKV